MRVKIGLVVSVNQKYVDRRGPKNKRWAQEEQKRD